MTKKSALILLCPEELFHSPPKSTLPEGYYVRHYKEDDQEDYLRLLEREGWTLSEHQVDDFFSRILPDGLFFIVYEKTNEIVASAVALHNPKSSYYTFPFGSEIGFVFTSPIHRNKGLGRSITAFVTNRLISAGYKSIRLVTNDYRLPALKAYINIGFVPFLYSGDMEERWREVYKELHMEFDLSRCITTEF